MKILNLILLAFILSCPNVNAQALGEKEITIKEGKELRDSLTSESIHSYVIKLDSAEFVYGFANQESVDVVVSVFDPEDKEIASFDGPARGPENFQFETKSSGTYSIKVSPFEKNEGSYSIYISEVEPLATDPAAKVNQLMIQYSGEKVPGAAVMVMKDDEIIFQDAYGMASLTYNVPFKTNTPTNIGSTSKQFTAFAISLLANRGKLSLDDDIREYFPELPDFGKKISIRNLLTHTSGYREYLNTLSMTGRNLSSHLNREKIIEIVQNQPELQNAPGAKWNYNNTGYALLATLVKRVTNTPFPQWMLENIFKPLEMNNTVVRKNQNQIILGRSQGYNLSEDGEFQEVTDLGGAMGAGGIYTTLEDLAKWIRNFDNPKVGTKNIIKEMTTPFVLTTGDTTSYGLGLFVQEYKGLKQIHHGGADVAHRSMLMYFPEIDAAVITQSNNANFAGSSAHKVADIFFSEYMVKEEAEKHTEKLLTTNFDYNVEKFDLLAKKYELEAMPGFILNFKREGERIYTQATGQPEVDMHAMSDSLFKLEGVDAQITFHLKENGTADSLTLHQNGNHNAVLLDWKPGTEALKEFTGKYFSTEIQTMYSINMEEDTLMLNSYLLPEEIELNPADTDSFGAGFPITNLIFTRNTSGEVIGFEASNGRSTGIYFEKME